MLLRGKIAEHFQAKWTKLFNIWPVDNSKKARSFWLSYLYKHEKLNLSEKEYFVYSLNLHCIFAIDFMAFQKRWEKNVHQGLIQFTILIKLVIFIKLVTRRNLMLFLTFLIPSNSSL